jgi:antitoxin (DNA-binding transcriptional repressor) of toxin-antitoxin stability system
MRTVTFTEFRKDASGLFDAVEHGDTLVVMRHGKPIAEVHPFQNQTLREPAWKRPGLHLRAKGAALADAIIQERRGRP